MSEQAPGSATANAETERARERRDAYRAQLQASIGGWSGTLVTAIPTAVFIIVNVLVSLRPAVLAAIGSAAVLAGYRLARKQPVQQAVSGLIGVVIAALIAARSGQARDYFLLGIITSFVYAVPFVVSMLVRRPLVGVVWEFLDPSPPDGQDRPWYRRRPLFRAYLAATAIGAVLFLSRGVVQATLYGHNDTGWLAVARIAMGYPLFIAALAAAFWVVRGARQRSRHTVEDSSAPPGAGS